MMMNSIYIKYPDGIINTFNQADNLSLQQIVVNHGQLLPDIDCLILINENTNTILKRKEILKPNIPYKLVDCREMIKCFNGLRDILNQKDIQISELQKGIQECKDKILKNEQQNLENLILQQKQEINELKIINQDLQNQNAKLKQLEKNYEKLKSKKQQIKKIREETIDMKSGYEKQIVSLEKDVEFLKQQLIYKDSEIKKKEEEHNKKLEDQKINFESQISREYDRVKRAEQQYEVIFKEYTNIKTNLFSSEQQKVEISKMDKLIEQKKIDEEIEQLKNKNNLSVAEIKKLTQSLEQLNNQLQKEKEKIQEYEKKVFNLEKDNGQLQIEIKILKTQICQEDEKILQMEGENEILKANQYNNFKYRLMRLVELIPRYYRKQINFAVEKLFQEQLYKQAKQQSFKDRSYLVYKLEPKKIQEVIFKESNLDISQSITTSLRFNYHGQLSKSKIESVNQYDDNSKLVDSIQLFYCKSIDTLDETYRPIKQEQIDKIFIIKKVFLNDSDKIGDKDTILNFLCGPVAAQAILQEFLDELKAKKFQHPFNNLQFVQPILFGKKINFKQYFSKLMLQQKLQNHNKAFQQIIAFLKAVDNANSNDFYGYIRELQNKRIQDNSQDGKIQFKSDEVSQTNFLETFIQYCIDDQSINTYQNILEQHNQCSNQDKLNAFQELTQLLGGIFDSFPQIKYYYGYEVDLKNNKEEKVFQKYNGGDLKFHQSAEGKFFSALSYYSIQKTHHQFCLSHIQGIGNNLYDPVISSYDGFLNCFDQGLNEIQYIESVFESSDPQLVGSKYIQVLGIDLQQKLEQL